MDDDCQVLAEDNNNDQNVQINEDDDPLIAEVGYGNIESGLCTFRK